MSNQETTPFIESLESLTDSELRRIKKKVLGYGNFKATATKAKIHVETLRGVITRGYGETETIKKIRDYILTE